MKGKYLNFIKIEKNNEIHYNILKEISNSTPYLGKIENGNSGGSIITLLKVKKEL